MDNSDWKEIEKLRLTLEDEDLFKIVIRYLNDHILRFGATVHKARMLNTVQDFWSMSLILERPDDGKLEVLIPPETVKDAIYYWLAAWLFGKDVLISTINIEDWNLNTKTATFFAWFKPAKNSDTEDGDDD